MKGRHFILVALALVLIAAAVASGYDSSHQPPSCPASCAQASVVASRLERIGNLAAEYPWELPTIRQDVNEEWQRPQYGQSRYSDALQTLGRLRDAVGDSSLCALSYDDLTQRRVPVNCERVTEAGDMIWLAAQRIRAQRHHPRFPS